MSIVLVRHGETSLNAARVLQQLDTPLGERGIAQAQALARRLATIGVVAIVSSDLPRATMTADAISSVTGVPVATTPLLQERDFGELRGRSYDEIGFDPLDPGYRPPGGEDWPTFVARVARAFAHVAAVRATIGGSLVVVTHGLVIRAMLEHHARLPDGAQPPRRIANASVTILDARPPHTVSLLDCAVHLEGDAADDPKALSGF